MKEHPFQKMVPAWKRETIGSRLIKSLAMLGIHGCVTRAESEKIRNRYAKLVEKGYK